MEVIIFLIMMSIFSALTNKGRKPNQRPGSGQQPTNPMSPRSPMQSRPLQPTRKLERPRNGQQTRPLDPRRTQQPGPLDTRPGQQENIPGSLGSLIKMLSGEDEAEARKKAREEQDRLYREQAEAEQERMRLQDEENERLEALRREEEMRDPDEIGDIAEIGSEPVPQQQRMEPSAQPVSPLWNLSEAKKGIIWHEILDGPKFKTRGQGNRRN